MTDSTLRNVGDPPETTSVRTASRLRVVPSARVATTKSYGIPRGEGPIDLWLDGNEGPSPAPEIMEALAAVQGESIRRYPKATAVEEALAQKFGVSPAHVIATAGADEALDRVVRAMLDPGMEIVMPVPSFEMIERYANLAGATIVEVLWRGGPYPIEAVIDVITSRTRIVCIVTPNNPTGLVASLDDVRRVAEAAPHALVLLDQAYAELADEDLTAPALAWPNVVAVRSLSKAFGLAGARVGCALARPEVIGWLRAAGSPYNVSGPSLALALRRLSAGNEDVDAYIDRVRREREVLYEHLLHLGLAALRSQANFVFARCSDPVALRDAMAKRGVAIRAFPGKRHLEDAVRITCPGGASDFDRLYAALTEAIAEVGA